MEVILREHVDNLGKRGEIVKVADGYARNYLLPRKLALARHRRQQEADRARAREVRGEGSRGAEDRRGHGRPDGQPRDRRSPGKVGENDVLFGSVTTADIARRSQRRASRSIGGNCSWPSRSRSSASSTSRSSSTARSSRR